MSGDRKKGIIITKHLVPGGVTIWPKGLILDVEYHVSYQEGSGEEVSRLGRDLIEKGINLKTVVPGELVYLNLPLHPGSKQDKEPPTPPTGVTQKIARNMGNPGVELSWMPGTDNNWISYYEVLRDGKLIDKVAKGTYYFDHSAGADLSAGYEVRTVDGAGNLSMKVTTEAVPYIKHAIIYDDGSSEGISFIGDWQHQTGLQPAHAGTITFSNRKGAAVKMTFEGKKLFLFSKLGDSGGKAVVSVDGNPAEIIDTYSADDIWGVCVFEKELPAAGMHTLRIEVLGEHSDRAKDSFIYIDGVRVER